MTQPLRSGIHFSTPQRMVFQLNLMTLTAWFRFFMPYSQGLARLTPQGKAMRRDSLCQMGEPDMIIHHMEMRLGGYAMRSRERMITGMLCALAGDGGCFYGTLSKGLGGGDQPQDVIEGADVIFPAVGF